MDLSLALRRARLAERAAPSDVSFRCVEPVRAIGPLDPEYPRALHSSALRPNPPALFVRGAGCLPEPEVCVALIGARRCTEEGRSIARSLAVGLARAGITVVSGLALGIDAAAHEGALDGGGKTIAVLASPVDDPSPRTNARLADEIVGQGWLVSERPPAAAVRASEFPKRNRLVVALSAAVIVVEAGLPSGTLGTVRLALAAQRAVGAVPGSILAPASRGANALLGAGAAMITSVDDALALVSQARAPTQRDYDEHEHAMLAGVAGPSAPTERWLRGSGLPEPIARKALLRLLASGALARGRSGLVVRCL